VNVFFCQASIRDQEGSNAQKLVKFKSPNDKLSNDTPHDYGTLKYKITVFNKGL